MAAPTPEIIALKEDLATANVPLVEKFLALISEANAVEEDRIKAVSEDQIRAAARGLVSRMIEMLLFDDDVSCDTESEMLHRMNLGRCYDESDEVAERSYHASVEFGQFLRELQEANEKGHE